jgi:hypothetical protein
MVEARSEHKLTWPLSMLLGIAQQLSNELYTGQLGVNPEAEPQGCMKYLHERYVFRRARVHLLLHLYSCLLYIAPRSPSFLQSTVSKSDLDVLRDRATKSLEPEKSWLHL